MTYGGVEKGLRNKRGMLRDSQQQGAVLNLALLAKVRNSFTGNKLRPELGRRAASRSGCGGTGLLFEITVKLHFVFL